MTNFRKYSAAILLIFALFAINGAEFLHHHSHDEQTHTAKCEACIINHSLNHGIVECSYGFTPFIFSEFPINKFSTPLSSTNHKNNLNSRAPPSVWF